MKPIEKEFVDAVFSGKRVDGDWKLIQFLPEKLKFNPKFIPALVENAAQPSSKENQVLVRVHKNHKLQIGDPVEVFESPSIGMKVAIKKTQKGGLP